MRKKISSIVFLVKNCEFCFGIPTPIPLSILTNQKRIMIIFIDVQLNIVFVSSVWQNDSVIHVYIYRRRQWHPTPVLLPGKPHGQKSLVGCSPWGR